MTNKVTRCLVAAVAPLVASVLLIAPAQAAPSAPASVFSSKPSAQCVQRKNITNWQNLRQVNKQGFNADVVGSQASMTFNRNQGQGVLSLDLAANPTNTEYTASRITEVNSSAPISERVKCWQPTETKNVVAEYVIRFDQAATPANLTENMFFWNAPLPASPSEQPIPFTTIGVTRSLGSYRAVVAQNLDIATFSGLLQQQPMPEWLDASQWHTIRVTISQTHASVQVAQGSHSYSELLKVALQHAPEPLAFEFSVDSEAFPGLYVPVTTPDGLDIAHLDIRLAPAR
jgi:hypothetical protein